MSGYQEKLQGIPEEKKKIQFEEIEQESESAWKFKTTMLRALEDKVENMQEQVGNVSKEIEILREKKKKKPTIDKKKKPYCNRNEECL